MSGSDETALRGLEKMDLAALREAWRDRYGEPPKLRAADLLRRMLAWKIQIEAAGGVSPDLKAALRKPSGHRGPTLPVGVKLSREWKGIRYEVEIVEDGGVLYDERTFESLSAVARQITGARWNGPRFFGLRTKDRP
jgi:hypothetical protein